MRLTHWLVIGIVLLAALLAASYLVPMLSPPWVEVVGNSVLRTSAPLKTIAEIESTVIDRHRNIVTEADGTRHDPSSSEGASGWSSGPSPQVKTAEVIRGHSQITDKDGHRIAIERITSSGLPAHIFVEFDGPQGPQSLIEELLVEFQKQGVRVK